VPQNNLARIEGAGLPMVAAGLRGRGRGLGAPGSTKSPILVTNTTRIW